MQNIIVSGAGHGGLVAASRLAAAGFYVTVYEKRSKEALGYGWHDRFTFSLLAEELGIAESELPANSWEYRGDTAFISPSKRKRVEISFTPENRQRIMLRKKLISLLLDNAEKHGVHFRFNTTVDSPVIQGNAVTGIKTNRGDFSADLVIDAAGVFSPLRSKLPKYFQIENTPKQKDVFYAYRAYFKKTESILPETPFEVYLRHNGEQGLSWFYTAEDYVDILIGRTQPLSYEKAAEEISLFRKEHPWFGNEILCGGEFGVIPVRRPLTLMVANGYAAIGDSAFMTTPMNGMGVDLSILAGRLLADTVINASGKPFGANVLWEYNRDFHILFGGDTAKNEGLKNALLNLPMEGVDFLFEKEIIQAADLSGAGKNMRPGVLLGKLARGMKAPPYFGAIVNGLMRGSRACRLYKTPPLTYDLKSIIAWSAEIAKNDI